jgi:uncharacterized protein (TIGR03067 family)
MKPADDLFLMSCRSTPAELVCVNDAMNRMRCISLLLVTAHYLTADFAAVRSAEAVNESPQAALRGAWRAVSMVQGGKRLADADVRKLTLVFSNKTITIRVGKRAVAETTYLIDAESKPARIDMTFEGQSTLGVYEHTSDKLRICLSDLSRGRPKKISVNAGQGCDADLLLRREGKPGQTPTGTENRSEQEGDGVRRRQRWKPLRRGYEDRQRAVAFRLHRRRPAGPAGLSRRAGANDRRQGEAKCSGKR